MGILDYITSRISLGTDLVRLRRLRAAGWPGHDKEIATIEKELYGRSSGKKFGLGVGPVFDGTQPTQVPILDNPSDVITINGGKGNTAIAGPGTFLIQPKLATFTDVREITMQPDAATTLQLVLGSGNIPLTAIFSLSAKQPWSWPGQVVQDSIYLIIGQAANVQVEARARPLKTT